MTNAKFATFTIVLIMIQANADIEDTIGTKNIVGNSSKKQRRLTMLTLDNKLTYIKSNCQAQAYCAGCRLVLEKTCPKKNWRDWTADEIETAFNIIYGGEIDDGES